MRIVVRPAALRWSGWSVRLWLFCIFSSSPLSELRTQNQKANNQSLTPSMTTINANATPTFGIFVQGTGKVPLERAMSSGWIETRTIPASASSDDIPVGWLRKG